jgi:RNA polymerase sigma-70 factor (ECF subfamily)
VAAAQQGDVHAFNQLVVGHQTMAFNVAYRLVRDADAAADATQKAFLSAYHGLDRFRGGSFKAWILRIVTNACYDHLRAKKRRPTSSLDDLLVDPDHTLAMKDDSESPEDRVLRQDLDRVIQRGLSQLNEEQRATLVLSDIQGFSYEEIAGITQVSLGTVKSRLSRARTKMREYLQGERELLPSHYRL